MTLTVVLALLASLIGWVMVVREFAPRTSLATLAVLLIASFHYSTHAFSTYHGGEILLQAATPWIVLMACRVPEMNAVPAALLAVAAVFLAFLAKLSGVIVLVAALVAGSLVCLAFRRRITQGMIGGALGAVAAIAAIYVAFLSRGPTMVSETSWSLPFYSIAFPSLAPWVVGMSWEDAIGLIYLLLRNTYLLPNAYLAAIVPPALLVAALVWFWRPQTIGEKNFRLFSLWFYVLGAAVFFLLYISTPLTYQFRYFRSLGTLLFVCALMSALAAGTPTWTRGLFLVSSALMALYGLASFSYHELTTAKGQFLDRWSWTNQRIFDAAAIDFAREAYTQEGRDALFVLPSNQLAVTLPTDARIIVIEFNEDLEATIAGGFSGRVQGHVVVLMPNSISDTSKGRALLSAFRDYAPNAWERKSFAEMSVFFQ